MEWLKELNQEQIQAVLSTEGPLLVLAGAGSGKTRVITYRIAYILSMGLAKPDNILAITFTNKAADEMKERIKKLVSVDSFSQIWVSTFHAACARILRIEANHIGFSNNYVIFDTQDKNALLKECYKRLNIDEDIIDIRYVSRTISNYKNTLLSFSDLEKDISSHDKRVVEIYKCYTKLLKQNNAFDFDDLIYYTIELFRSNPDILEKYQKKFKYILVDEYQDTNHAQFYLVDLLAKRHRNICVVGDDDQSIYSFRGADINNILQFEKIYPDAKVIRLEKNYRSTKIILKAANSVIKNNTYRKGKNLWTDNSEGSPIFLYRAFDEVDEAEFIAKSIKNFITNGIKPSEIGVLYRTNAQSLNLENALSSNAIPYRVVGSMRFYERKEIKDILAYLRLIINPRDNISFMRVINTPKRGIGHSTIEKIQVLCSSFEADAYDIIKYRGNTEFDKKIFQKLNDFIELIDNFIEESKNKGVAEIIKMVAEKTGYLNMLSSSKNEDDIDRIKNIEQLVSAAALFDEQSDDDSLQSFLNTISLSSDEDMNDNNNSVSLMTVHAAKGLEFDVVFLSGLEEGLFPLYKSNNISTENREIEEERRLCYVAITRAKKYLVLTYANNRRIYGRFQSRQESSFLDELPSELVYNLYRPFDVVQKINNQTENLKKDHQTKERRLTVGDKVEHKKFGFGKVLWISDDSSEILIDFDKYGQKRLLLSFANIRKIG